MVAYKADDAPKIARNPKRDAEGFLLHGGDPAQISDLARQLAAALSARSSPPGDIIRIAEQDLAQNPGRLMVELQTLPMFGGRPVIWLRSAQGVDQAGLESALTAGAAAYLIVEAGNLAKTSKLRLLFERLPTLAALPCYGADAASVAALIEREVSAAGKRLAPDAALLLREAFGASAAEARPELEKLLLYAAHDEIITAEAVEASIGDLRQGAADSAISACLSGDARAAFTQLDALAASGFAAQGYLALLNMHLLRLLRVRTAMDGGEPFALAVKKLRPPLHFRAERAFSAQCRNWSAARLAAAVVMTQETARASRLNAGLEQTLLEDLTLRLSAAPRAGV